MTPVLRIESCVFHPLEDGPRFATSRKFVFASRSPRFALVPPDRSSFAPTLESAPVRGLCTMIMPMPQREKQILSTTNRVEATTKNRHYSPSKVNRVIGRDKNPERQRQWTTVAGTSSGLAQAHGLGIFSLWSRTLHRPAHPLSYFLSMGSRARRDTPPPLLALL
jgi:hypothetical protein